MERTLVVLSTSGTFSEVMCIIKTFNDFNQVSSFVGMEEDDFSDEEKKAAYLSLVNSSSSSCDHVIKLELQPSEIIKINSGITVEDIAPIHMLNTMHHLVEQCNFSKIAIIDEVKGYER